MQQDPRYFKTNARIYVGSGVASRKFVNAVLWMMRSGAQWLLLSSDHGKWNSVFKRFDDWCKKDVWTYLHENAKTIWIWTMFLSIVLSSKLTLFQQEPQAARVKPKALGLSVAGYTTKIHAVADAPGNPIDFILTEGQASDVNQALPLLELVRSGASLYGG